MFETLILRYGLPRVIGAAVLALVLAIVGASFGWAKVSAWYYHHQDAKHVRQRDEARAQVKVARADEKQTAAAAQTTAETVAAQDAHAQTTRAATHQATEAIHERIRQAPVAPAAAPADDPVVRRNVDEALARAQAAEARLRGTPRR